MVMPVRAFYERETDTGFIDVRGMIQSSFSAIKNPDNRILYSNFTSSNIAGLARLIVQGKQGDNLDFEMNACQSLIPASLLYGRTSLQLSPDVERSGIAEKSFSSRHHIHFFLDRLNLKCSFDRVDLTAGRQPINLATTFYFTPNDFFAPFAARTFYRVYKPGVDAVRAEVRIGELSRLSLISVLGYRSEPGSETGWSNEPDAERTSCLGRISLVFGDFEYGFLGGVVRDMNIAGFSIQGELFRWLGVRAEGHYASHDSDLLDSWSEMCVGIEHHWENSLDLRFEYFFHGSGAGSVSGYSTSPAMISRESAYAGRRYAALGIGYELTPLMDIKMTAINNMADDSYMIALNGAYSLSDESELVMGVGLPVGEEPEGALIKTEFGSYPHTLTIEIRWYF